jgi:hypothetical protein
MPAWTPDRVITLAPDPASAAAGQALATLKKWSKICRSERAIWGLCQGSGKDPYQARIDLSEPAFKCSCPSRKFPCKHGLALLLLFAKDEASFKTEAEPGWVTEWMASRSERAEKKVEKAKAAAETPVDLDAQAKRAAQREARVLDGVASCHVWLEDLVRRGLAAAQTETAATWDRMAARMVDAQAPGLAAYVRQLTELIASGAGWDTRALDHLGRLHLLLKAGDRLVELPGDLAVDVRTTLGWTHSKEDVLAGPGVADRWITLGQVTEDDDRLRTRRTWLAGRSTGRRALVLDFAAGRTPFDASSVTGTEFDGELTFYPSRQPMRALVKSREEGREIGTNLGAAADPTIESGLRKYAEALAANPWMTRWPMVFAGVRLAPERDQWFLVDSTDSGLPVKASFAAGIQLWRLLSASGGSHITVMAEWDGVAALPLSAVNGAGYHDLAPRWDE